MNPPRFFSFNKTAKMMRGTGGGKEQHILVRIQHKQRSEGENTRPALKESWVNVKEQLAGAKSGCRSYQTYLRWLFGASADFSSVGRWSCLGSCHSPAP